MSREDVLARGRAAAEAGMADRCRIVRKSPGILNQSTGERPPVETVIYEGICRVQQAIPGGAKLTDEGESSRSMLARQLQLPVVGSEGVQVGDEAQMTVCPNDSDMVGRVLRVKILGSKTEATARRLGVEEVT